VFVDTASLVESAAAGDSQGWDALVDRYSGLVWAVARGHGLQPADAADVSQTTWLRLAEHLRSIKNPDSVGAWLATTARRESLRVIRGAHRQVPADVNFDLFVDERAPAIDQHMLDAERDRALWQAYELLPQPCRALLRVLMTRPRPSYAEVSAALGMPIGSIGPTRGRCLDKLRRLVGEEGLQVTVREA
jgi:RNA polymerase sigma factor (sigma-70 family)